MSTALSDKTALILRPAYPYGKAQTWLPMDLYKVAAKLDAVGVATDLVDLNFDGMPENLEKYDFVGIGVVGPPYVPVARELATRVYGQSGKVSLIGGQGVEYLSSEQFRKIYPHAYQVRNDLDLGSVVGRKVSDVYSTSIAGRIQDLGDLKARKYLSSEFSFFVSQGCTKACDFCLADRSRPGQKVKEKFSGVMQEDLIALTKRACDLGITSLSIYLSPLDLFQNPASIVRALELFSQTRLNTGIEITLRGLSRVDSFLAALDAQPQLYELIPASNLKTIGFGVDGTAENVWRSQRKGKMSLSAVDHAFSISCKLDITPEALLVMGYYDEDGKLVETSQNLQDNVSYALHAAEKYGAVARPHVAKNFAPGNNGWKNSVWKPQREKILRNPDLFRNLDFVALASELTHPDADFRGAVNNAYLEIIKRLTPTGLCATTPLLPIVSSLDELMVDPRLLVETLNLLVPFDR